MSDVPRRLPRTQGQRIRNVDLTAGRLSGQGMTAAARPVPQQRPENRIYQPPTVGSSNVVTGDSSGEHSIAIISTAAGGSAETVASGGGAIAVGWNAQAAGDGSLAIGYQSMVDATGVDGIAIGINARAEQPRGIAIGSGESATIAYGTNSVAIGSGATAFNDNEISIGAAPQYVVPSALCLVDNSGNLHRLVVGTDGALSTVAYP